jgi:hypothetical protein
MSLKGTIPVNHFPENLYKILITGVPAYPGFLVPIKVSDIEEELEVVMLPDRTYEPGGQTKPGKLTITIPLHDSIAQGYMETWYYHSQQPVNPTYKKAMTIINRGIMDGSGFGLLTSQRTMGYTGCFPNKFRASALDMEGEGKMVVVDWEICFDDRTPL